MDDIWTGSKAQKAALREKFQGRCAYCGELLEKMHAEGRPLPREERRLVKPERNVVSNMMPACGPCNLHKGGFALEEWRQLLARSPEVLSRDKSIFRAAVRFGLIEVRSAPVVFYFEKMGCQT